MKKTLVVLGLFVSLPALAGTLLPCTADLANQLETLRQQREVAQEMGREVGALIQGSLHDRYRGNAIREPQWEKLGQMMMLMPVISAQSAQEEIQKIQDQYDCP